MTRGEAHETWDMDVLDYMVLVCTILLVLRAQLLPLEGSYRRSSTSTMLSPNAVLERSKLGESPVMSRA